MQASRIHLPKSHIPPSDITTLLFEPNTLSLTLTTNSSSTFLFPSFPSSPPLSLPPLPSSSSSSSTFLLLPNINTLLLVIASPCNNGPSQTMLRFFTLNNGVLVRPSVRSSQRDLIICDRVGEIEVGVSYGVKVMLVSGDGGVLVMYSVAAREVWVMCVRDDGERGLKVIKCGVVECKFEVFDVLVSGGFLVLGEEGGVRVFGLRRILKGRVRKSGKGGGIRSDAKPRTVKLKQDSCNDGTLFVAFKSLDIQKHNSASEDIVSLEAITIKALCQKIFVVLDSLGDLHILSLCIDALGSDITGCMRCFNHKLKVKMLALRADPSIKTQTLWVSDGFHSVHMMSISEMELSLEEKDKIGNEEKSVHVSGIEGIFTSEKIHGLVALSTNAVLVLGQDNIFTYAAY